MLPHARYGTAGACFSCKVEKERTGRQGGPLGICVYVLLLCAGGSQHGSMELVQEGAFEGVAGAQLGSSLSSLVRGAALQGMLHFGKEDVAFWEGGRYKEEQGHHDVVEHCARRVRTGW